MFAESDGPAKTDDSPGDRGAARVADAMADKVSFLLYQAAARAQSLGDARLAALGITGRHFGVLALLAVGGPQPQGALARRLGIDRTTMVSLIDDLERRDLVVRHRDPADLRAVAAAALAACERDFLADLSPTDRDALAVILHRLLARDNAPTDTT